MAFFTRVNTNVPFLPNNECHSENDTQQHINEEKNQCTNSDNRKRDVGKNGESGDSKNDPSSRYGYVKDRVLGVEV